jgi:hypothetical protein
MAIVSTLPKEGQQAAFYEIPDGDLQKYTALDIKKISEGDKTPDGADKATQVEAPGAVQGADVEAYRHRHVCRCYVYNRYTGYIYYWYWCIC